MAEPIRWITVHGVHVPIYEQKEHIYKKAPGLIFGTAHVTPDFVDIDGYSNKKTEKGMLEDLAKAVEKFSPDEADVIRDMIKYDEINQMPRDKDAVPAQYILEWEEVSGATREVDDKGKATVLSGKEAEDVEYKDAKWYIHLRYVKGN